MSLVTRCPICHTAFRVQTSQLAAQSGTVRCGKCGGVFNGVAGLVEEEGEEQLAIGPSPQLGLFDPGRQASASASATNVAARPVPEFLASEPRSRRATWLWALAVVLGVVILSGQVAYRFRAELAASSGAARAAFLALCQPSGCDLSLPRHPELMSIDASELQADTRRDGIIILTASIRNRARFAQAYPALELTLTDENDYPVLRRVLAPRDYLDAPRTPELLRQGIAPGSEAPLRVYLDTSRTRAIGYRLYLFYPL
jgi:predicted Zn finger-like uncharacterized protein